MTKANFLSAFFIHWNIFHERSYFHGCVHICFRYPLQESPKLDVIACNTTTRNTRISVEVVAFSIRTLKTNEHRLVCLRVTKHIRQNITVCDIANLDVFGSQFFDAMKI